jgi:YD repeat-containing protein
MQKITPALDEQLTGEKGPGKRVIRLSYDEQRDIRSASERLGCVRPATARQIPF